MSSRLTAFATGLASDGWVRYPECSDRRVVADVIRLGKGHTEGLEPHVTEEIVNLMLAAK
jgi:hypothetical protein